MKVKDKKVKKLLERYKEISLLGKINSLLGWDLNVNLPDKGAEGRASQVSYLTGVITDKWLDKDFRKLVEDIKTSKLTKEEKAVVRNLRHAGKYYFNVPKEIVVEFSEATSKAYMVWQKAKSHNDFKSFLPHLKKLIKLNKIIADHLGYEDNPYDALLDLYEPGFTTKKGKEVFGNIQPELTKILKKIKKTKNYMEKHELVEGQNAYSVEAQKKLSLFALHRINYDLDAGRMDVSSHPFTSELGRFDVRITNRYSERDFRESLMVALHEGGHALYEQGIDEKYDATPLEGGVSLGIHESQSRFWENQVGRSREFMDFITPVYHAFFPEELSKASPEIFYKLFNMVRPSLIRTEADEVTYNLHIALRFELEGAMISGKLEAEDLPEAWNKKMKKYLGIVPETYREGVLQDVHWSHGPMGYFPTYTLGNLYAAQFTEKLKKEIDMGEIVGKGELGTILSWQRSNIHKHGSLYWPDELSKKVTGKKLSPKYFLAYIKKKYSKIYEIKL